MVRIAIDAMGGDHGPSTVLAGADIALVQRPEVRFHLFGEESKVVPLLDGYPRLKASSSFSHCDVTVQMDDKPSQALRKGRWKSSMWRALEAVKKDEADVAISAGNTGALMAMSSSACAPWPASSDLRSLRSGRRCAARRRAGCRGDNQC